MALKATLQLIDRTPGVNQRAVITVCYATPNNFFDRDHLEAALKHAAEQLAICCEMKSVFRLGVDFSVEQDCPHLRQSLPGSAVNYCLDCKQPLEAT